MFALGPAAIPVDAMTGASSAVSVLVAVGAPTSAASDATNLLRARNLGSCKLATRLLARKDAAVSIGESDARDDAPGRYTSIWVSGKEGGNEDTLFIYSVRNIEPADGVSILAIRITTSWFRMSDGLCTGYTLGQMLRDIGAVSQRPIITFP
jgi:hypothetical protein